MARIQRPPDPSPDRTFQHCSPGGGGMKKIYLILFLSLLSQNQVRYQLVILKNDLIIQKVLAENEHSEDYRYNQKVSSEDYTEEELEEGADHLTHVKTNNNEWREDKTAGRKRQHEVQVWQKDIKVSNFK